MHWQALKPALSTALWLASALLSDAAIITEDFTNDPLAHGWRIFGDTSLFVWNAANHNLNVTWDSSRANSYFYLPLGTILDRYDDFSLALDLQLTDVAVGVNSNKPSTFELALGFLNPIQATKTNFLRGNSFDSPNLVEFDFFPEGEFAPTVWPSIWSTNSSLNYNGSGDYTIIALPTGLLMRITMSYTASNRTLATSITTNGTSVAAIHDVSLSSSFTDFRVAAFAVESYSDAGQDPRYGGSLLAHGSVGNVRLTFSPAPVENLSGNFTNRQWAVMFTSRTNWLYTLERTADFQFWTAVSPTTTGGGMAMALLDTNPPPTRAYYRVRAEKP